MAFYGVGLSSRKDGRVETSARIQQWGGVYGAGIARPQKGSSIVIGFESALEFWRRVRIENPAWARELLGELYPDELLTSFDNESLAADSSLRPLELPRAPFPYAQHAAKVLGFDGPIDVVVGRQSSRRRSSILNCRVWNGTIADGLIACVDQGVYVCSPELVVAQLASAYGLYRALAMAMEFCGTYAVTAEGNCEWDMGPLTTAGRIRRVIELSDRFGGKDLARQVSFYCMDGSASPMETSLSIMLSLPRKLGGWGCGKPLLNERIELNGPASRECARSYLVADLLFERAGIDVEYQGREWHTSQEDRASDEARQNALLMMGMNCLFVSKEQIHCEERLDGIAETIRSMSGLRPHRSAPTPVMRFRRSQMMSDLGLAAGC